MGRYNATSYDNTYCYENTDVLRNKLNIRNKNELAKAEMDITYKKENLLITNQVKGDLDYKHLRDIHKVLLSYSLVR